MSLNAVVVLDISVKTSYTFFRMLSFSELKPGTTFVLDGEPYVVLEYNFLRMQQRRPVAQTKIKNLRNGKIVQKTFMQSDSVEEAEIEREPVVFIYENRGDYWFHKKGSPKDRFQLSDDLISDAKNYLKPNMEVMANKFGEDVISVEIPIKMDLKVKEAAPAVKGNTVQGGTKEVVLETGMKLNVPMFVNEGDIVRVNTETGTYVERVEKA